MNISKKSNRTKPKNALRDHYDLAVLSKKLATIDTESPVEFVLGRCKNGKPVYTGSICIYSKRLEFKNLLIQI